MCQNLQEDGGMVRSREIASLRCGIQTVEYSNGKKRKRRELGAQDLARM